ncbi:ABC transporter permease [Alkaliphilus transvaalensis]|uniref:ABC transporter permease n=1 Tax=Alkaliphilus transvaalensis TaxID=114628 RepID=UPI00047A739D|nr:ABC transporter permease [Alkaliphilus transvaalensis]
MWQDLFNMSMLYATLRAATPLIITAIGGLIAERSGIINIALEGKMLMGAFTAVVVSYYTGNPWLGVLGAIIAGGIMALIHGVVSIKYKANQVVSGTAINILAGGLTIFLLQIIFGVAGTSPQVKKLPAWGPFHPIVYFGILLVFVTHYVIYYTSWGLRVRAIGEHPSAADTVGINVIKMRYICVIISGMLAGLAGAALSLGDLNVFVKGMTSGRGYIALAAMIFGKWTPIGALGASLLFGYSTALQMGLQGRGIPSQIVQMIPYIFTMIALAGFVGKSTPPAALGEPYDKAKR